MHVAFAAEAYLRMKHPNHSGPYTDVQVLVAHVCEKEILKLAADLGEKEQSIASTVTSILSEPRSYRRVTSKQKIALAQALLDHHKTALAVYAAAYALDEQEFLALAE